MAAAAKNMMRTRTGSMNQIPSSPRNNTFSLQLVQVKAAASRKSNEHSNLISKKGPKRPNRPLISISTAEQRWHGRWSCDYVFTLQDLRLLDLVEDQDARVHVTLSIQQVLLAFYFFSLIHSLTHPLTHSQHASFGLSVEGRIVASLAGKCTNCSIPYCQQIDTSFNVWVLGSDRDNSRGDVVNDPSVIYVKPGYEATLDSLVRDAIRLTMSSKDTCSEACAKSGPTTIQYVGRQYSASTTQRWQRLLKLRSTEYNEKDNL